MNISNRVIIFSVFRPENTGFNTNNHVQAMANLRPIGPVQLEGCYKGDTELSIMLPYTEGNLLVAKTIGEKYNQDSILVVNADRTGTLLDPRTGETIGSIGKIKAISELQAKQLDYHSYNPATNQYFGVV